MQGSLKKRIETILGNLDSVINQIALEEIQLYKHDSSKIPKFLQNAKVVSSKLLLKIKDTIDKKQQKKVIHCSTTKEVLSRLNKLHKDEWVWIKV